MIGTISIKCNAAHPEMALPVVYTFVNSPSSIRVLDVPRKIGKWAITNVYISAIYPDNTAQTAACVLTGGCWVGTIDGNATAGTTKNGFAITASGTDENGDPVTGYILGKGDFCVLEAGETPQPDAPFAYVHLLDGESEEPKTGDLYPISGDYYIWQNGQRNQLGGGVSKEELATKADLSIVENLSIDVAEIDAAISSKADVSALTDKADVSALVYKADVSALLDKADVSALGNYLPLSGDEDANVAIDVLSSNAVIVGKPQYEGIGVGVFVYEGHISLQQGRHTQTTNYYGTDIAGDGTITQCRKQGSEELVPYATLNLPRKTTPYNQTLATLDDITDAISGKADVSALADKADVSALADKADVSALGNYLPFDPFNTSLTGGYARYQYALTISKKWDKPDLSSVPTLIIDAGVYADNKRIMRVWDADKNNLIVGFNGDGLPQIMYGYDDFDLNPNPRTLTYPTEGGTIATLYKRRELTAEGGVYQTAGRSVYVLSVASGVSSVTVALPDVDGDEIADFIIDVDNSANVSAVSMAFAGLGTDYYFVTGDGEDIAALTTTDAGGRSRVYFSQTAQTYNSKPVVWVHGLKLSAPITEV